MLAVSEPPVDELTALLSIRLKGSCRWLTANQKYVEWRDSSNNVYQVFLLTGNAAMGKSVLSSHVITDLQNNSLKCSYFFFKHGDILKSSISACLRSLAYQMGSIDEDVLSRLLESEHLESSLEEVEEGNLWKKLFAGAVFRQTDLSSHFWVIDALDECYKPLGFLSLLRKLPLKLKIFVTSRQTSDIEGFWPTMTPLPFSYKLKDEDTLRDLELFIDSRMVLPLESDEMRTKLKKRILQKACGSFLWVSLVISELEQAYSAGFVENILNEVPADMNRLYERMLGRLPKDPRVAKLSKTILTWTVLSLRSLTILETQYLVSLALDDTIFGLNNSYMSICGQLVRVDNSSQIKLLHQTTRTFLLQQESYPEFAVNALEGHSKLAKVCLEFLTGNDFKAARNQRMRNSPLKAGLRHDIANYTCTYFSDHLQKGSSEGLIERGLLCKFFDTSVLSWIEHLASIGKTRHISRSAYNLQFYISRRIKHLPSTSPQRAYLESWIVDLIRVSVKFRRFLSTMPSSIFTLIPAMCPAESMVRKLHNDRFRGIAVVGKLQDKWDDYLVHMDHHPHQPTAVAYGSHVLAVALSNGAIFVYHWDSVEMKFYMNHGERISLLTTSECGNWIASGGLREVRVWNARTGSLKRTFSTKNRALTVLFDHDGASLTVATQENKAVTWSLTDGTEQHEWQIESIRRDSDWIAPYQPPNRALFSPDYTALAISYRGFHTYLFNMENESFVGCYHREKESLAKSRRVSYWVDALTFNPNPEISVLIISYGDGEIVVYDLWSTEIRFRLQDVFAHHLACSSDGRYLVATSSQGAIKIFRFKGTDGSKMSLNYRIDDNESVIRGVAVSREGFRVANIDGNCCSVWEPPLSDPGAQEENGQNQLSQVTTIDLKGSARLNQSLMSEITAMCCHSDGEMVFYGRRDGSVLYMDTENAKSSNILYSHTRDVTVISITYLRRYSLLVSVDEASQILVHKIKTLEFNCETTDMKTSVSLRQDTMEALKSLLVKEDCNRFLAQRLTFAQIWTGQGELVGSALQLRNTEEQLREETVTMMNHPFRADCFLCIKHEEVFVYSWLDGSEIYHIMTEAKGPALVISPCHEPFTGEMSDESKETSAFLDSHQKAEQHYVVTFSKVENVAPSSRRKTSALKIWKAKQTSAFDFRPLSVDTTTMSELESSIAQIITVNGQLLLYVDVDFWVCSVSLAKMAEGSACTFHRHFFLLSEWRRSNGKFLIKYIPAKHDFAISRQSDALIIKRGFDYSQSWTPTDSLATPIERRSTNDTNDLAEIE